MRTVPTPVRVLEIRVLVVVSNRVFAKALLLKGQLDHRLAEAGGGGGEPLCVHLPRAGPGRGFGRHRHSGAEVAGGQWERRVRGSDRARGSDRPRGPS